MSHSFSLIRLFILYNWQVCKEVTILSKCLDLVWFYWIKALVVQLRRQEGRSPDLLWSVGVDRRTNMRPCVYILKDANGKLYVGSTDNIQRRIKQHKYGHTQTSRNMINPKLVLFQEYYSIKIERKIEKKIKSLKRKDYIEKMINDGYIKLK